MPDHRRDDATHEAVAIIPEHSHRSIGGNHLVRLLDEVCAVRDKSAIIRTDNVLTVESSTEVQAKAA
ncbi:hypothetical protein BI364_08315 [Acidihalobacter yilgarnensis]|uniref:Uncharacterized protein n=1 Tax=Acidihalobacter yilgarnensis TaxID=2819280 RepID=A0A1D8INC4_9GAMM|nr:hypothetical protein BI364_08315 [Acidihalobacter yilgarnensis]